MTINFGRTIRLGWRLGINVRRMRDANNRMWLLFVIWYPRSGTRLGYLYPSMRWF